MQKYKAFSKAMKLPEQMPRVYQDGLGQVSAGGIHMKLSDTTDKWAKAAREEILKSEKVSEIESMKQWKYIVHPENIL